jgi:hypothetical protein
MFTKTSLDAQKTMEMQIRARGNTAERLRNKTQYANNAGITLHSETEQSSIVDFRRYIVVVVNVVETKSMSASKATSSPLSLHPQASRLWILPVEEYSLVASPRFLPLE